MKENKISYGQENDLNLKTIIALTRANNVSAKRAAAIFREGGLTMMQFAVLEVLYHKGDMKIGEIIEKVLATGGNMTVVIKNLEKEGMVERYQDKKDSRAWVVRITPKGKAVVAEIFPKHLQDISQYLNCLTKEEKESLCELLKKVQMAD